MTSGRGQTFLVTWIMLRETTNSGRVIFELQLLGFYKATKRDWNKCTTLVHTTRERFLTGSGFKSPTSYGSFDIR